MKYFFILSLIFLASCSNSAKDELLEPESTIETQPKENSDVNESINEDSDNQLPATIKTIHNAKFQVVEIMDSAFVKVILLDVVNREDFEEVEGAVLKTRKKFGLYNGIESTGKVFFKFYSTKEHYDTDALPAIAATYYNNLNGKTGMDIYWGRSADITKIIHSPERKVIQK